MLLQETPEDAAADVAAAAAAAMKTDEGGSFPAAAIAGASGEEEMCTIFIGPPQHPFEERMPLRDWLRLIEHSDVGEAGALSEWSPTDPNLIVTKSGI